MRRLRRLVLGAGEDVKAFRRNLERTFSMDYIPCRVAKDEAKLGGIKCDVLTPEAVAGGRTTVYVHGGSFAGGSRESYRGFCAVLAHRTLSRVIVPEYRLAPSFRYPVQLNEIEDVLADVSARVADESGEGARGGLVVAADGSGASLALGAMLRAREDGELAVSRLILLSPWLDLSKDALGNASLHDEVLRTGDMRRAAALYADLAALESKYVSPLRAAVEDFEGFPEVYIQAGAREILLSQAERFCALLEAAGVHVTLDAVPGMMFMFQMADGYLEEPCAAIERIARQLEPKDALSPAEERERLMLIQANHIMAE